MMSPLGRMWRREQNDREKEREKLLAEKPWAQIELCEEETRPCGADEP